MADGIITTLYSDRTQTEAIFPRTKTSAVSDNEGRGLDAILDKIESQVTYTAMMTDTLLEA